MNRLGMIVDISHVSDKTFYDTLTPIWRPICLPGIIHRLKPLVINVRRSTGRLYKQSSRLSSGSYLKTLRPLRMASRVYPELVWKTKLDSFQN
jgi:hypothetical protein